MNDLYSMRQLVDIIFPKTYRYCEVFVNRHAVAFFEASVLKEVCILDIISVITLKY